MTLHDIENVRSMDDQIFYNNLHREHLAALVKEDPLSESVSYKEILDTHCEFKLGTGTYYIHRSLYHPDTIKTLCKLAPAELHTHNNSDKLEMSYIQHIYVKDKYLEYRDVTPCTVDRFDTMLLGKDKYRTDKVMYFRHQGTRKGANSKRAALKARNMPMIRYMQQGNNNPLVCRWDGVVVEDYRHVANGHVLTSDIFSLHHILVVNNKSANKLGNDPSALIAQTDLTANPAYILDLLGTVALSLNAHKVIHSETNTDIDYYTNEQLPWALQTEQNFNMFVDKYLRPLGTDVVYQDFLSTLSANNYTPPPIVTNELSSELFESV